VKEIIKDIKYEIHEMVSDKSTVRKFGFIFSVILLSIAGWLWYKSNPLWIWFGGGGIVMALLAAWATFVIMPLYKGMTVLAIIIGYFISKLIITLMFILFFIPIGLIFRLTGKDLLDKKINKNAASYWLKKENTAFSKEKYERLF
jgi:hypothetical protein